MKKMIMNQIREGVDAVASMILMECNEDACKMSDLARKAGTSTAAMTGRVDRMVSRGLIERRAGRCDRRVTFIHVTDFGRSVLDRLTENGELLERGVV